MNEQQGVLWEALCVLHHMRADCLLEIAAVEWQLARAREDGWRQWEPMREAWAASYDPCGANM